MCDTCGCQRDLNYDKKVIEINKNILDANNAIAQKNKQHIESLGAIGINLISSPGAGKTTLLEKTAELALPELDFAVIEGDIETEKDAERIRKKGVVAVQLTTGGACHLDARLVHKGLHLLQKEIGKALKKIIFIENVGNLVCPAAFALGEHKRVVMLSVPEGSDKPAKYPRAFLDADLFVITKIDLLDYFDFSIDEALSYAQKINPQIKTIALSAKTGQGMDRWLSFLRENVI